MSLQTADCESSRLYLGRYGWGCKEWFGPFFTLKGGSALAQYGSVFNTVEVNSTFYASVTQRK